MQPVPDRLLHNFIEVGEYGLALEEITGTLAQDAIAITGQERGDMLALARHITMDDLVPRALGFCPSAREPRSGPTRRQLRLTRPGLDFGRGSGDLPAGEVVSRAVAKGIPPDRQRAGHVRGRDGQRNRHPDVIRAPAVLGGDLGSGNGMVGQSRLDLGADASPGAPAAATRHAEPHPVTRRPLAGRPPRHAFMIT